MDIIAKECSPIIDLVQNSTCLIRVIVFHFYRFISSMKSSGKTPLDPISEAIFANDFKKLITSNYDLSKDDLDLHSTRGNVGSAHIPLTQLSPIFVAAMANSLECYRVIESKTGLDFSIKNSAEYTPLHYACLYGSFEIAMYIFGQILRDEEKANKWKTLANDDITRFRDGKNLIFFSTLSGSHQIMQLLLDNGWGGNNIEKHITKAISTAVSRNSPECLKILIKYKRNTVMANANDLTPLMSAISSQTDSAVPVLLQTNCNLNHVTSTGHTALSIACLVNMESAVKLICQRMQTIDLPPHAYGKFESAVQWMCSSGNPRIVKIMLEKHPNLHYVFNGKPGVYSLPPPTPVNDIITIFNLLNEHGYTFNACPDYPEINHFLFAISPKKEIIKWFIDHGTDLSLPPPKNLSQKNQLPTIRDYIKKKAKESKEANIFAEIVNEYPQLFEQN